MIFVLPDEEPPLEQQFHWWPHLCKAARRRGFATGEEVKNAELAGWAEAAGDIQDRDRLHKEGEEVGGRLLPELAELARELVDSVGDSFGDVPTEPETRDATAKSNLPPVQPRESLVGDGSRAQPSTEEVVKEHLLAEDERDCAFFSLIKYRETMSDGKEAGDTHEKKRHFSAPSKCLAPPCPARPAVQLGHKAEITKGMGLELRCRRWQCFACAVFLRIRWQENLRGRLEGCPTAIHRWLGPTSSWETVQERIRRAEGSFCRVVVKDGTILVLASEPFKDGKPVETALAVEEVTKAIAAIPQGAKRPVSASHDWKLPDNKTGEWCLMAHTHDMDRTNAALEAMGVIVTSAHPTKPDSVQKRFIFEYPPDWNKADRENAHIWAASFTVPPTMTKGSKPPDPGPLQRALLQGICTTEEDEDFTSFPSLTPPPTIPIPEPTEPPPAPSTPTPEPTEPPPPPQPQQRWFRFAVVPMVSTDPRGGYVIVEYAPDGTVQRKSRKYRTQETAQAALDKRQAAASRKTTKAKLKQPRKGS